MNDSNGIIYCYLFGINHSIIQFLVRIYFFRDLEHNNIAMTSIYKIL